MNRINVVGTSGSGKSYFSKKLAKLLGCQYIEMDALYWGKDWTTKSNEAFLSSVEDALQSDGRWVLDGNYSRTTDIKWKSVDTVIWIDYSFLRTLYQSILRSVKRSISKQELWEGTGCRESFMKSFFSRDSIILWMLTTYSERRVKYINAMTDNSYSHINFVRITSTRIAREYLQNIEVNGS